MRHLLAIALASLAAAACSSAPTGNENGTETTASTAQDVEFCPVGTRPECNGSVCKCVVAPPPPQCGFDTPTPPESGPQYHWYIEAWATAQTDGQCPDVPAATGTWKNVDPGYPAVPTCFNGVPCEDGDPQSPAPSCTDVYGSQPCCTYVWWPAGFTLQENPTGPGSFCDLPGGSACESEPNDASALCQRQGQAFTALLNVSCVPFRDGLVLYSCGRPGGSSCSACSYL